MHPLNTVKGAITTGVVLAVIIGIALSYWMTNTAGFHGASLDRWLHILSGVNHQVRRPTRAALVSLGGGCDLGYGSVLPRHGLWRG